MSLRSFLEATEVVTCAKSNAIRMACLEIIKEKNQKPGHSNQWAGNKYGKLGLTQFNYQVHQDHLQADQHGPADCLDVQEKSAYDWEVPSQFPEQILFRTQLIDFQNLQR